MRTLTLEKAFITALVLFLILLRLENKKFGAKTKGQILICVLLAIVGFGCVLSEALDEPVKSICLTLLLCVFLLRPMKSGFFHTLFIVYISYALSQTLYLLSLFLSLVIFHGLSAPSLPDRKVILVTYGLELILAVLFYKSKPLFSITVKRGIGGIALSFTGLVIILYSLFREGGLSDKGFALLFSGILVCVSGFIYWLRRETALSLHAHAQKRQLEKLCEEIESMTQTHTILSAHIHRENKRLPAIQQAVEVIIQETENQQVKEKALGLFERIRGIRQEWAWEIDREAGIMPLTGMPVVDAILVFMNKKAEDMGIRFTVEVLTRPAGWIAPHILETLIADFIENALYAVSHSTKKDKWIQVSFQEQQGTYTIETSDNGIPFKCSTLARLGHEQITTHAADGGSGYGYQHVFSVMKECVASLTIIEKDTTTCPEKRIIVQFDQQRKYVVCSDRIEQIQHECAVLRREAHIQEGKIIIETNENLEGVSFENSD